MEQTVQNSLVPRASISFGHVVGETENDILRRVALGTRIVVLSVIIILIPSATGLKETEALGTGADVCYQVPHMMYRQFIWRMFPNDSHSLIITISLQFI